MIRIVTDSMSDLTQEEAQARDFRVLPLTVRFGNEEFLDRVELSLDDFYTRLATVRELPKTSQVSPESFLQTFEQELGDGAHEVLCITGSSKLSGTYQSAVMARDMCSAPDRVFLFDSLGVSLSEALLVDWALSHRQEYAACSQLFEDLTALRSRCQLVGKADVLRNLVLGGRLSVLGGAVGTALHIKPLLRLTEGKLSQAGICRGNHRALEWFAKQLEAQPADASMPMIIAHAHAPEAAETLRQHLTQNLTGLPEIRIMEIGTVVGTHGGQGIIGLTWITQQ